MSGFVGRVERQFGVPARSAGKEQGRGDGCDTEGGEHQLHGHGALRGVRTDIVLPRRSNHVYTTWASRALYEDLLESGLRIHEREPPFIHAKALAIDDRMAVVGSANWDYRSLHSNYETCVALYDTDFVTRLELTLLDDLRLSTPVDLAAFSHRPVLHHYLENACGLLAPLL